VIDFANSRGADKIIYAGYFRWGCRSSDHDRDAHVPLKDEVWPKFLAHQRLAGAGLDG